MADTLKENWYAGKQIKKSQIPAFYIQRYGVSNLYRYHHPEGYRSCYTIVDVKGRGLCPLILKFMSHSEYERRFGYS